MPSDKRIDIDAFLKLRLDNADLKNLEKQTAKAVADGVRGASPEELLAAQIKSNTAIAKSVADSLNKGARTAAVDQILKQQLASVRKFDLQYSTQLKDQATSADSLSDAGKNTPKGRRLQQEAAEAQFQEARLREIKNRLNAAESTRLDLGANTSNAAQRRRDIARVEATRGTVDAPFDPAALNKRSLDATNRSIARLKREVALTEKLARQISGLPGSEKVATELTKGVADLKNQLRSASSAVNLTTAANKDLAKQIRAEEAQRRKAQAEVDKQHRANLRAQRAAEKARNERLKKEFIAEEKANKGRISAARAAGQQTLLGFRGADTRLQIGQAVPDGQSPVDRRKFQDDQRAALAASRAEREAFIKRQLAGPPDPLARARELATTQQRQQASQAARKDFDILKQNPQLQRELQESVAATKNYQRELNRVANEFARQGDGIRAAKLGAESSRLAVELAAAAKAVNVTAAEERKAAAAAKELAKSQRELADASDRQRIELNRLPVTPLRPAFGQSVPAAQIQRAPVIAPPPPPPGGAPPPPPPPGGRRDDYRDAARAIKGLGDEHENAGKKIDNSGRILRQFFRYALGYAALYQGLTAIRALVVGVADLDEQLRSIQAITSSTDAEMLKLETSIKRVAVTTKFTTTEISKATRTLAQAGVLADDIPKALEATANFAAGTEASLETAADLITTMRNVYKELDDVTIANQLTKAANISKLNAEELKSILSLSAQTAQSYNLTSEQYLSAVTTLRNAGIRASTVATGLRQALTEVFALNNTSLSALAKRYEQLGESLNEDQIRTRFFGFTKEDNPLTAVLAELDRIGYNEEGQKDLQRAFNIRGTNALSALVENYDEVIKAEASLTFGQAAAEASEIQLRSLNKSLDNLGAAFTVFGDNVLGGLVGPLEKGVDAVTALINKFNDLDSKLKATGELGLGGAAGPAVAGGVAGNLAAKALNRGLPGRIVSTALGALTAGSVSVDAQDGDLSGTSETVVGAAGIGAAILTALGLKKAGGKAGGGLKDLLGGGGDGGRDLGGARPGGAPKGLGKIAGLFGKRAGLAGIGSLLGPVGFAIAAIVSILLSITDVFKLIIGAGDELSTSQRKIKGSLAQAEKAKTEAAQAKDVADAFDVRDARKTGGKEGTTAATLAGAFDNLDAIEEQLGAEFALLEKGEQEKLEDLIKGYKKLNAEDQKTDPQRGFPAIQQRLAVLKGKTFEEAGRELFLLSDQLTSFDLTLETLFTEMQRKLIEAKDVIRNNRDIIDEAGEEGFDDLPQVIRSAVLLVNQEGAKAVSDGAVKGARRVRAEALEAILQGVSDDTRVLQGELDNVASEASSAAQIEEILQAVRLGTDQSKILADISLNQLLDGLDDLGTATTDRISSLSDSLDEAKLRLGAGELEERKKLQEAQARLLEINIQRQVEFEKSTAEARADLEAVLNNIRNLPKPVRAVFEKDLDRRAATNSGGGTRIVPNLRALLADEGGTSALFKEAIKVTPQAIGDPLRSKVNEETVQFARGTLAIREGIQQRLRDQDKIRETAPNIFNDIEIDRLEREIGDLREQGPGRGAGLVRLTSPDRKVNPILQRQRFEQIEANKKVVAAKQALDKELEPERQFKGIADPAVVADLQATLDAARKAFGDIGIAAEEELKDAQLDLNEYKLEQEEQKQELALARSDDALRTAEAEGDIDKVRNILGLQRALEEESLALVEKRLRTQGLTEEAIQAELDLRRKANLSLEVQTDRFLQSLQAITEQDFQAASAVRNRALTTGDFATDARLIKAGVEGKEIRAQRIQNQDTALQIERASLERAGTALTGQREEGEEKLVAALSDGDTEAIRDAEIALGQLDIALDNNQSQLIETQQALHLTHDEMRDLAANAQYELGEAFDLSVIQARLEDSVNSFANFGETAQDSIVGFLDGIGDAFAEAVISGENAAESIKDSFDQMLRDIVAALVKAAVNDLITSYLLPGAKGLFTGFGLFGGGPKGAGLGGGVDLTGGARGAGIFGTPGSFQRGGIMEAYAGGGIIQGPGTGTSDEIPGVVLDKKGNPVKPIFVSDGESILTEKATKLLGEDLILQINAGRLIPEFANGGLVSSMRPVASRAPAASSASSTYRPYVPSAAPQELRLTATDGVLNKTMKEVLEQQFKNFRSTR